MLLPGWSSGLGSIEPSRPKKGQKPQKFLNPGSYIDILEYLHYQGYNAIFSTKEEDLKALKFPWADRLLRYRRVSRQV